MQDLGVKSADIAGIEFVRVSDLRPNPANPRCNDSAVDAVARSIAAFGFNNPIITDGDLNIAAGHTRLKAAIALGLDTVPVLRVPGLSGSKFTGYAIADNQTATIATWDDEKLHTLVAQLNLEEDFDLSTLGFTDNSLADILRDAETDAGIDDVPEPPAVPVTQPGDLWLLGPHRLYCGDSTLEASARAACGDLKPFIMVTDPPYGVEYDPQWRNAAGISKTKRVGKIANDDQSSWARAYTLFPGSVAYVWHAGKYAATVDRSLVACGFEVRAQIIWVKNRFALSRGQYHWRHEPCWYAVRKQAAARFVGGRKEQTVWASIVDLWKPDEKLFASQIDEETLLAFDANTTTVWEIGSRDGTGTTNHATQKPVECTERPMRNHGARGDVVYDPFVGSGTSIVAAERCGRVCCAIELDPGYCDVTIERWSKLTGKGAVRATG